MLLTLAEVARRLGVSEPTARKIVRQWSGVEIGRRVRYQEKDVIEFAQGGKPRDLIGSETLPLSSHVQPVSR